eukprot:9343754-Lingulodinium_polyedra.AAC.1
MSVWTRVDRGRYAERTTSTQKWTVRERTRLAESDRVKSKYNQSVNIWISISQSINLSIHA